MDVTRALYPRQSAGSASQDPKNNSSASQLVATLVPTFLIATVYIGIFLYLRPRLRRNYGPRSFLGSLRPQERSPDLPTGLFNWIGPFNKIPDSYVLNHSLDGFLLLRYLKMSVIICFVGCLITWPVLFPINATGGGSQLQLNLVSFSNITKSNNRYYAHTFVGWTFFSFVFYIVMRESMYYITLRQAYLLSPLCANRTSSRTVLFTSVPTEYLNEGKLRRMFGEQVKNLWIAKDCEEIEKLVEERNKVAMKLEAAETKLIQMANRTRLRANEKGAHEEEHAGQAEAGSIAARWVKPKQRPAHRMTFLIGKKVDTINWCRSELQRLIPKIDTMQANYRAGGGNLIGAVFVEYCTQTEAQAAYQSLAHHQPLQMSPRFIGINPEEVIWESLRISWSSRIIRNIATTAFVTLLIVFWAIPVAFLGAVSNVKQLSQGSLGKKPLLPWLSFINAIPTPIIGLVEGLLPSVLLAVLMAFLPIILRKMAKIAGEPSLSSVELRVQSSYFLFQVIQVFLVTTATSGASAAIMSIINQPSSALTILATDLPTASNFYISYFILQGLAISSGALLQFVGVISFKILGKFLDFTPRKMYNRFITLVGLGWGTVFPLYTLLTVIALTYSIIAPLVLGFATIGLYLIYQAYRYNLLFVFNTDIDTKGLVYPRALQQTMTGVYLGILCLIGLFAIKTAIGPLILMIIYLSFLVLSHFSLNSAIDPLLMYLPKSLQANEDHIPAGKGASSDLTNKDNDKLPPAPHKKPSFLAEYLSLQRCCDYDTMRRLAPCEFAEITDDPVVARDAFYHPATSSPTPILWIPRDSMGISTQECRNSSEVISMTDEAASFDEKGNLTCDYQSARPPSY